MLLAYSKVALVAALVSGGACATTRGGHSATTRRADRELITREQIQTNHYTTAYEAVEALHSNWLRAKGPDSFGTPTDVVVYVNENRVGGVDALKEITVQSITSIRHLDGLAASARWGVGHGQGAIVVTTLVPPPQS